MAYKEGDKYQETKDLDITEVAKLLRKDLKEAFPEFKFSVRIERYSMGQSIHVAINNTGLGMEDLSPTAVTFRIEMCTHIMDMADRYNFTDRDSMQDYWANKFFTHVRVDS